MKSPQKTLGAVCVVLGITGSIAAVEVVKLSHALRRKGATVQAVMSAAACGILHPDAVSYATGREALTRISGMVEHVRFCGEGGDADILLIAPCTANTLCKIAAGIDDTPVTTFATTAIGRGMPVIIVPAMHHSMFRHPAVTGAIERLTSWGIAVLEPRIEEGKAKIAERDEIVLAVERACMGSVLRGKQVLVTSGPCREPVDDIRILTTRSSGMMGREIALQAYRLGADVTVVHADRFPCVDNITISSAAEMRRAVLDLLSQRPFDYYISAAAISDFAPRRFDGKIPSGAPVMIELEPLPKLLDEVTGDHTLRTVAFKLGWDEEERAGELLERGVYRVVVNTPEVMGTDTGSFSIMARNGVRNVSGTKEEVAAALWAELL